MAELTQARLRELLNYNPETGVFTWRLKPCDRIAAGMVAGGEGGRGYSQICIGRTRYQSHRLAWFYVYGEWPIHQIDHINLDRADNRIANLREATPSQNGSNRKSSPKTSNPLKGANWDKRKKNWVARICIDRRVICLGRFKTAEQAHDAYMQAARKLFGEFARAD